MRYKLFNGNGYILLLELSTCISCFELIEAPATEPIMYNYPKEKLWKVENFLERRVNYMHFNFNLCKSVEEERFVEQKVQSGISTPINSKA